MTEINDPEGTVFRSVIGGYADLSAGATSLSVALNTKRRPGLPAYNVYCLPNWNAGQPYETTHITSGFVVTFPTPVPAGGGRVRWLAFIF